MLALAIGYGCFVLGGLLMLLSGVDADNPMAWYQVLAFVAGLFTLVVAACSIIVMGWYLQERREEKSIWESENKPDGSDR